MKPSPNPIFCGSPDAVSDPDQPAHRRHHAGNSRHSQKPALTMTSMIDVVFLLLIFFVLTASFQIDEGTLQATMPGYSGGIVPPTPMMVELTSSDDGVTYSLRVNGASIADASDLAVYMADRVQSAQMRVDDLVEIKPQGQVRWQHVLNVYNACVNAELEQVTFAR